MQDADVESLHKRMDEVASEIKGIHKTLEKLAVQDEKIRHLQCRTDDLAAKVDALTANDGPIAQTQQFQASCPRQHIKYVWLVVIPQGVALLGMGIKILAM